MSPKLPERLIPQIRGTLSPEFKNPGSASAIWASMLLRLSWSQLQARLREIIEKVNGLFDGELTDDDKLVYVNNVIKGKLLESLTLQQQAASNTKEQFASSPDLKAELLNAIMGALDAHTTMSTQALNSATVRDGMKDILLNHAALWETLRDRAAT